MKYRFVAPFVPRKQLVSPGITPEREGQGQSGPPDLPMVDGPRAMLTNPSTAQR